MFFNGQYYFDLPDQWIEEHKSSSTPVTRDASNPTTIATVLPGRCEDIDAAAEWTPELERDSRLLAPIPALFKMYPKADAIEEVKRRAKANRILHPVKCSGPAFEARKKKAWKIHNKQKDKYRRLKDIEQAKTEKAAQEVSAANAACAVFLSK